MIDRSPDIEHAPFLGMNWRRVFLPAAMSYVALKIVLLAVLSLNTQYVMDEYAQAGYQLEGLHSLYASYDPVKTVLYILFYRLAGLVTDSTMAYMAVARLMTLALALGTVALTYRVARNLGRDRSEAWFSLVALLSFSTFMERAFRTRSDSIAGFLFMAAAWALTRPRGRLPRALVAGLLGGLAFVCTQKSVYFLVALGVGLIAGSLSGPERSKIWRRTVLLVTGWGLVLLVYAIGFGGWDFLRILRMVFLSPVNIATEAAGFYPDIGRWVVQTLSRNVLPYALCILGMGVAFSRWRSAAYESRTLLVTSAFFALLVFLHNQPWPYVFVALLPFLSLWAPELVDRVASRRVHATVSALLLVLLSLSLVRNVGYLSIDNYLQNEVTLQAESLLGPNDRYCDGLWMVVTRQTACSDWWDAPTFAIYRRELDAGDESRLDRIFAREPKVWIVNYRVGALGKWLGPRFDESYVRVYRNLLLAGTAVFPQAEPAGFVTPWSGGYVLYRPDGRPAPTISYSVDGRQVVGETALNRGLHRVALGPNAGGVPHFLLPAGLELPSSMPASSEPRILFEDVYGH